MLLVVFFAAYLVDKRELLAVGHAGTSAGCACPTRSTSGRCCSRGASSILVMVQQKDLGSSLLFFAVFVAMLYIATERPSYLVVALGAVRRRRRRSRTSSSATCRTASSTWIDPWSVSQTKGYQLVQSLFAFGSGGFAGTGLGLGSPQKIPVASTDFVFAAIGEELGLLGTVAVVIAFLLLVGSGFRIAVQARRPFSKLFAAGLTTIIGVQTFVIIGGVTRVIPLTGVTLPFISYGGSSLVANFVILALLLRISDETVDATRGARRAGDRAHRGGSVTPSTPPPARR